MCAVQARTVALAVSQGLWGPLPGPLSTTSAPIHEDVLQVALSGGKVQPRGRLSGDGGGGSSASGTGGDGSSDDTGGGGGRRGGRGGGEGTVLWLSLPFVAALLPGASPATRKQAAMSVNIALKVRGLCLS